MFCSSRKNPNAPTGAKDLANLIQMCKLSMRYKMRGFYGMKTYQSFTADVDMVGPLGNAGLHHGFAVETILEGVKKSTTNRRSVQDLITTINR